jgi:hypothetical protein
MLRMLHRESDKWIDRMKLSTKKGLNNPGSPAFIVMSISFKSKAFFEENFFLRLSKESAIAVI